MNAGGPEGVNSYSTVHFASFNQWGSTVSLHTMLLSELLSFCV